MAKAKKFIEDAAAGEAEEVLKLTFDMNALTFADWETLDDFGHGEARVRDFLDMLERGTGRNDIRSLKLSQLSAVAKALNDAIKQKAARGKGTSSS